MFTGTYPLHVSVNYQPPYAHRFNYVLSYLSYSSFGVILWEMFVKKPFFGDLAFIYEIEDRVQAGQRPEIPPDCPLDYTTLIKYFLAPAFIFFHLSRPYRKLIKLCRDCWAQDPKSRPTFNEVVHRLHECIEQRISINSDYIPINEYPSAHIHLPSCFDVLFLTFIMFL